MKRIAIIIFIMTLIGACSKEKWTTYRVEKESSPKNDITSICFDKHGSLWIGSWSGVYKYSNGVWVSQGIDTTYVQSLFIDKNDIKWAGLWGGGVLQSADGINWAKVPEAATSHSANVIRADHEGSIWVGDWSEGLFNLIQLPDGKSKWVSYHAENVNIGDNSILSITSDTKNQLWIGTYHGVSLYKNNTWTLFNKENSKLTDNTIYSLASDEKDNIWIGTYNGLVRISGSEWTIFNNENSGLSCDLILSLAPDLDGNIWVGTNKGAFFFDGKNWKNFTVENSGLPDNRIQSIAVYNKKVYFGTSKGLAVYEK